jgi:hypothetical protein
MGMHVKIISGFNVGREYDFSNGERELKIGRAADADVQLHADDRNCARGIHARLLTEAGVWFVEADHDNGVVLAQEGKSLVVKRGARQAIARNARLTLGTNGPELRLAVRGAAPQEMAPTLKNDQKVADMPVGELTRDLVDAAGTLRPRLRRLGLITGAVFIAAMLVGGVALVRSEMSRRENARFQNLLQAQIRSGRADADARLSAIKGEVAALDEQVRMDLVHVLRGIEPSVVMLALADQHGEVKFVGTGWCVGERVLATNAHVGDALREGAERSGLAPVARRAGTDGVRDIRIEQITCHPGYSQWSRIFEDPTIHLRHGPAGTAAADALITPYDVALLRTADDCGPAIPLASVDELQAVTAGDEVGYVGYPAENVFDPRGSPPALLTGRITRLTDFFYNPVRDETALLLHHNLPTVGGASGSPIVNKAGKVVAINSAGSFVGAIQSAAQTRPARIPVGFSYGQSIEFLRECLEDNADAALKARNVRWQDALRQFALPPSDLLDALAAQAAAGIDGGIGAGIGGGIGGGNKTSGAKLLKHLEQSCALGAPPRPAAVISVDLPADTTILVQACADDRSDIDLDVAADQQFANVLASDNSPDSYPQAALVTSRAGTYWVRISATSTNLPDPQVTVRISRLAK